MRADDPAALGPSEPRVREAPELAEELLVRYRRARPVRAVPVTDLLDPRPAFWQSAHPLPPAPEQAARQREGRRVHERVARALAPVSAREVRVRRDGIVGRVDVLDDRPLEIKSTHAPPDLASDLRASRPTYVEQVATYAALLDRTEAGLLLVGPETAWVWDVSVPDPELVRREMSGRAAGLHAARERGDPTGLPRCEWFGRGCAFQREGVCGCDGTEPSRPPALLDSVGEPRRNGVEERRVMAALRSAPPEGLPIARFRDLAYPRRGYFEGLVGAEERPPEGDRGAPGESWSAIHDLLEAGPPGEFAFVSAPSGTPEEPVSTFRGVPCLVKSTRSPWPTPAAQLVADRPHYVLELALRCAAVGAPSGWLVLGLDRVPSDGAWIRAQQVEFGSPNGLAALLERRAEVVRQARTRSDPSGLPACPPWLPELCPYRASCGCAGDSGRA